MKKEDELLTGEYDGIKEYDNDLPRWWVQLFWVTIIFGVGYTVWYHIYPGIQNEQKLSMQMEQLAAVKASQAAVAALQPKLDEEGLLKLVSSQEAMTKGKAVYVQSCAVCHGQNGEGLVGPNLTDDYWIHGGSLTAIRTVIEEGVLDKGMLAWKAILPADDINNVSAYIRSLKGTNPANQKAPQGDKVE